MPQPSSTHEIGSVELRCFELGGYMTNAHIVRSDGADGVWLIDAPFEPERLIEALDGEHVERILLTHAHPDHIGGLRQILDATGNPPVAIHAAERDWLGDPAKNLSVVLGTPVSAPEATDPLEEGQELRLGDSVWEVRHTPGHSPGSVSFICKSEPVAIVGDALFNGSIGRTDFPHSDHQTLLDAIKNKLYTLDPQTQVFPGHGPPTTIGHERQTNPFVRAD